MAEMKLLAAQRLKKFRTDVLKLGLSEMARKAGLHKQTLNSFEHGMSTNMDYLHHYHKFTDETNEQQFIDLIHQLMKDMKNGN